MWEKTPDGTGSQSAKRTTAVRIEAPEAPLDRIDISWRGMVGERILPWYFMAFDGRSTHGYGVSTGCACCAFWQVDPAGISLWLDVRNGGSSVRWASACLPRAVIQTQRGS